MTRINLIASAKVLLFWFLFIILMGKIGAMLPVSPNWLHGASIGGCISIVMIAVTYFFLRPEKLTFADIGMSFNASSLKKFIISLVAGIAFFGCFYLTFLWLTPVIVVSVQNHSFIDIILLSILSFSVLSAMEEIAFRGYALNMLKTAIGTKGAIYLTSLTFGLYHGFTIDSVTGPAVWGLLYAVLALWSKGLAIPIGFHAGANIIQALCSEKVRYADGLWAFELIEKSTPFTVDQISLSIKLFLLILGVLFVEIFLYRSKNTSDKGVPSTNSPL